MANIIVLPCYIQELVTQVDREILIGYKQYELFVSKIAGWLENSL
jgi:hypothetical protein